jgi:hypothetical protein
MYFTLDDIKDIADEARENELKKELAGKLSHYKLDFSGRLYRDEILKYLSRIPLDYLKLMAPRFNGKPPALQDLQKTAQDVRSIPRPRSPHNLSLDDRARYFVRNPYFKAQEIAEFVVSKAEMHRAERTAQLTLVNFKNYQERLKVENEVMERYNASVYFFKALEDLAKRELKPSDDRIGEITFARVFLQNRLERTVEIKKAVEDEMRRYVVSPISAQNAIKP